MIFVFTFGYKVGKAKPGAAKTCRQRCRSQRYLLMASRYVPHQLHVCRLSRGHGKDPGDKFVAHHVEGAHFILALRQPLPIVSAQLRIAAGGTQSSHVEHLLDLLVCQRAHLGLPPNAGARLPLEGSNTGIAGELAPGGKAGEVMGEDDQVHAHQKAHTFDAGDKAQHAPELLIPLHNLLHSLLHTLNLGVHGADDIGVRIQQAHQLAGQQEAPLLLLRDIVAGPVPHEPVPQRQQGLQLHNGFCREPCLPERLTVEVGILGYPSGIHSIALAPGNPHRTLKLQGRNHGEGNTRLLQVYRQAKGVEAGMLETNQYLPQALRLEHLARPPDEGVVAGAVIAELPV